MYIVNYICEIIYSPRQITIIIIIIKFYIEMMY